MSSVASTFLSTMAETTGNIEKAYIKVKWEKMGEIQTATSGKLSFLSSTAAALSSVTSKIETNLNECTFCVKFNPSELSFAGHAHETLQKQDFTGNNQKKQNDGPDYTIYVTIPLIFDKTDPADCFLQDKLNLSSTALAENAAKMAMALTGSTDYSVRPEVEAFVTALKGTNTRNVEIYWGSMRYAGILQDLTAEYTMFNVLGQPVRATVNLRLLYDSKIEKTENAPENTWVKAYWDTFKTDQKYAKLTERFSSLTNITL